MSDCSQHKKELFRQTDMKEVAEAIGDLHYETLSVLMKELELKLKRDSIKDWNAGKYNLASRLRAASECIKAARINVQEAWQISKPFMLSKNKTS